MAPILRKGPINKFNNLLLRRKKKLEGISLRKKNPQFSSTKFKDLLLRHKKSSKNVNPKTKNLQFNLTKFRKGQSGERKSVFLK